jgi:hypothetical protein
MEKGKRKPEVKSEASEAKRRRREEDEEDRLDRVDEENQNETEEAPTSHLSRQDTAADDEDEETEEDYNIFEAGMILKVHMENFMCHNKFTVTLGRMLNFLTGANGSGEPKLIFRVTNHDREICYCRCHSTLPRCICSPLWSCFECWWPHQRWPPGSCSPSD